MVRQALPGLFRGAKKRGQLGYTSCLFQGCKAIYGGALPRWIAHQLLFTGHPFTNYLPHDLSV